jgi:hypothetical protein
MKKLILITIIVFITTLIFAQDEPNQVRLRIGDTMEEIRKDVPAAILKQSEETGTYLLHDTEHVWVFYYIENNICHTQAYAYNVENTALVLQPFSDPNAYIRINNMKYLRIEDKRILTFDFSIEGNLLTLIVTKE